MFEMSFSGFGVNNLIYQSGKLMPDNFFPNENYLIRAILWRNRMNMNTFVLIVGNPRTSKSSFAIKECERLCELKNKTFDIDKQLTFDDIRKFLVWSQDAEESEFILDETGTTLSPDQFWSVQQRVMRSFIQTQGFRKNVLFWVLPSIVFIQKNFRFMSNYGVKTIAQGKVAVYKVLVDQLLGKGYTQYVMNIGFKIPKSNIWNQYIAYKRQWNDEKLKDDIDYMDMMNKPDEKAMLRHRKLELDVQLRQKRLELLNNKTVERIKDVWER